MANAVVAGSVISVAQYSALSGTFDVGTNPSAIVFLSTQGPLPSPTIGGIPLTLIDSGNIGGWYAAVYVVLNPGISGSQALGSGSLSGGPAQVVPYAVFVYGSPSIADSTGAGEASNSGSWTADTGSDVGWALSCIHANTIRGPLSGFTQDDAVGYRSFGHETASTSGSRPVGFDADYGARAGVAITGSDLVIEPTSFGTEVGFTAGVAIGLTGPQYILGARIRAVEVGFREGLRMGGTAKRQVALVGPDDAPRLFTPEMTENGNEGDILTQHADSPPTWEAKTHYEPVRFDTDGDGVADDWLFHTDGDVVMLEVEN